jgi:hypothetical protein
VPEQGPDRDRVFSRVIFSLVAVLVLYGCGMILAVLFSEVSLATKMLSGFGSMFAGILGLATGYLIARAP